jgi:flagellum-specific peptidoglycan hydrolase FlgJ
MIRGVFLLFWLLPSIVVAQTKSEVKSFLTSLGCEYAEIVTKQSILECGHNYNSYGAKHRNNLFGLWNHPKQEFFKFDHWQESCEAYMSMIYYKLQKEENYYHFLERIGYATDQSYIDKIKRIKL